jgi:hypothetical protein
MNAKDITVQIAIGVFLIVVGMVLQPMLTKMWAHINKPAPLSPRQKGSLVEQLALLETTLETRDHYKKHPNDLLLAMFQMVFMEIILLTVAICLPLYFPALIAFGVIFILVTLLFGVLGFIMAVQLSERNSESGRQKIVKSIAEIKGKLNL